MALVGSYDADDNFEIIDEFIEVSSKQNQNLAVEFVEVVSKFFL